MHWNADFEFPDFCLTYPDWTPVLPRVWCTRQFHHHPGLPVPDYLFLSCSFILGSVPWCISYIWPSYSVDHKRPGLFHGKSGKSLQREAPNVRKHMLVTVNTTIHLHLGHGFQNLSFIGYRKRVFCIMFAPYGKENGPTSTKALDMARHKMTIKSHWQLHFFMV